MAFLSSKKSCVLNAITTWLFILHSAYLASTRDCRCFPGDACWPSQAEWASLNSSVDGRLIATIPLASPCHDPNHNAALCTSLQQNWLLPQQHYNSSSSIMAPYFAGNSCDPFTPESMPCTLGNYVDYAINVYKPSDISKGIAFATEKNVRLVIRNTGHDYSGKSTGAGSLAIWTHNLKSIDFIDYSSAYYTGKAIKMGAGVQGFEAYGAGNKVGLSVTGGECPTVGLAGGYTQGGGHSALASKYGLAADQTLEWEVVTGTGDFITASPTNNSDLYWALSGGGGGTYGVVYSLTSKAHTDIPVSGANLTFYSEGVSTDTFYAAISAWHASLPKIVDAGAMAVYYISSAEFQLTPFTGPGISVSYAKELLQPFLDSLNDLGMKYNITGPTDFPSYLDEFNTFELPIEVGVAQYGGRLIPRSVVENNNDGFTAAIRNITQNNATGLFVGVGLNVNKSAARGNENVDNAVLPAWRETLVDSVLTTNWNFSAPLSDMIALQEVMTNELLPPLEAITPGSGCYLNEGDPNQPNWQETFYGVNYPRLLAIKAKYDPNDIFYATTAVGSDGWEADIGGRLCKV